MFARIKRLFSIYVACHSANQPPTTTDQVKLLPDFCLAGIQALPHALRWVRVRDPAARARVKQILDLSGPAPIELNLGLLREGEVRTADTCVTIIMPVYDNLEMTTEALRRLVLHTDVPWRLILVDDGSPSAAVRPALERFAAQHLEHVHLIALDQNRGFVGATNEALTKALEWDDPVVLLNTDAFLPANWASRLLAPILQDSTVATVTPMSNDAELGCVPKISKPQEISATIADRVDSYARKWTAGYERVVGPTGVGFCMAMARPYLEQIPQFDVVFAPGYGEEVDWCQKAAKTGGLHVYVPNLFVAHMGGQSFGSEAKARLIARNSEVLSSRYPRFDASVFGFIRNDPLVTARIALSLAWAIELKPDEPLTFFVGHSMGGGAEIDLRRKVQFEVSQRGAAVILRLGGVFRFTIELWWDGIDEPVTAGTDEWSEVEHILKIVRKRHIVYSNAVGDPYPVEIPGFLMELAKPENTRMTVLVHDYFILSPSVTLLGKGDHFTWPSDIDDARNHSRNIDGKSVDLAEWRDKWGQVVERSERIVCFSESSFALVTQVYDCSAKTVCNPHQLPVPVTKVKKPTGEAVIGVLGNISPHKGADIVETLSVNLRRNQLQKLVVLGRIDPGFQVHKPSLVHGPYEVVELPDLVTRYGITCWLIPSIWPETFSFTVHEAIETGLPVISLDIGAQADAVRTYCSNGGQGVLIPLSDTKTICLEIIKSADQMSVKN